MLRLPRSSLRPLLFASIAIAALVLGSTQGRFAGRVDIASAFDPVFAAIRSVLPDDAPADDIDLHDGLSPVPARWRANFERFADSDRSVPRADGGVVFVGSSSIDYWPQLAAQFPDRRVVQRGLAGATMADCARHADRLILPSRPRVVVVYAGDNDLAAGVAPERIVADFVDLVRQVHRELPVTKVVFVSIKPSPSRMALMPAIRRTNALVAAFVGTAHGLDFVDVFPAMLDRDERPRRELFLADGLHMTPTGYALWHDAIARRLD